MHSLIVVLQPKTCLLLLGIRPRFTHLMLLLAVFSAWACCPSACCRCLFPGCLHQENQECLLELGVLTRLELGGLEVLQDRGLDLHEMALLSLLVRHQSGLLRSFDVAEEPLLVEGGDDLYTNSA